MKGVYFQTWSSNWSGDSGSLDLAHVEGYDIVNLAFAKPDCSYQKGQLTFQNTGLDFSSTFQVISGGIKALKDKGVTVMLSVGGATYPFDNYDAQACVDLAGDLGVNGIDLDWEPQDGAGSADKYGKIIDDFKAVCGSHFKLSSAVFSVGAYGYGDFKNASPQGQYNGMNYPGIVSNGDQLDWINLMSYDCDTDYDPIQGFNSYRAIYNGPILIGLENDPQSWGGAKITTDQVSSWYSYGVHNNGGCFIWSLQKDGVPSIYDLYSAMVDTDPLPIPNNPPPPTPVPSPIPDPPQPTTPDVPCGPKKPTRRGTTIPWVANIPLKSGQRVTYKNDVYKVLQSHTTQIDWTPDIVPALFNKV